MDNETRKQVQEQIAAAIAQTGLVLETWHYKPESKELQWEEFGIEGNQMTVELIVWPDCCRWTDVEGNSHDARSSGHAIAAAIGNLMEEQVLKALKIGA